MGRFARPVTKWTTCEFKQHCHVGNTAQQRRYGLSSGLRLCWQSWGLKINIKGAFLEVIHLFQSVGCGRSKPLSRTVLQSLKSFSPDAGLRKDGSLALDLWDIVIEVLRSTNKDVQPSVTLHFKTKARKSKEDRKYINWVMWIMCPQTHILCKMGFSCTSLETTKPWSKMMSKERSPTMRNVSRTHRFALLVVSQNQYGIQNPNQICCYQ